MHRQNIITAKTPNFTLSPNHEIKGNLGNRYLSILLIKRKRLLRSNSYSFFDCSFSSANLLIRENPGIVVFLYWGNIFCTSTKYKQTEECHDGKWLMFDVDSADLFQDVRKLLEIKKSLNRRLTMCSYCCDMCKTFAGNIKKKDERNILSDYWNKYYDL